MIRNSEQYPAYTAPLFCGASVQNVSMHMYADDTQLYASFNPFGYAECIRTMQQSTMDIQRWMSTNYLKLNTSKTEVLLIGNANDIRKIKERPPIHIGQGIVEISNSGRKVGAVVEHVEHVFSVTRGCYMALRQFSHIRGYLIQEATLTLQVTHNIKAGLCE